VYSVEAHSVRRIALGAERIAKKIADCETGNPPEGQFRIANLVIIRGGSGKQAVSRRH
jgi:hypothetical protein